VDTTDSHSLEHAWHHDQERLAVAVDVATSAIIVVADDERICLFNTAAEHLFGCSGIKAIGTPLERFIPPRLHARYRRAMDEWRQVGPEVGDVDVRAFWWGLRNTGETFPCEVSIARRRVGGAREFVVCVVDITERRRSAKATRRRIAFQRFLFDLSRSFLAIPEEGIDANMTKGLARIGTFLKVDRVTLLELSPDRTAMTTAYSWNHGGAVGPPQVLTNRDQPWWLGQILRGDVSLAAHVNDLPPEAAAEKAYLRQRGVASAASIPLKVGGEIAGAISFVTARRHIAWTPELVSVLRAIGEILWNAFKRRQAMEALLAAREAARESEERFRLIANTAPVMIWMSDIDKQITYVNQRWFDFTGWSPQVVPGHRWIELLHPDEIERCGEVYTKAFDQRQPFQVDHRLRHRSGDYRWTVTVGVPRFRTDGSFAGHVGTATDITDRKRAEAALLESHAALQERTVELERRTVQLSQMASELTLTERRAREEIAKTLHDGLQQMLVIASYCVERQIAHDAERGLSPSEPLAEAYSNLTQAIAAARSLSIELSPPVLQHAGLPAALQWLANWAREKYGLRVEVIADPAADSSRADVRTLLFESVRELVFNAVKHANTDRIELCLATEPDGRLSISVTDHGIGFDPGTLPDLSSGSDVGWGLFSIRERVALLGGRFAIESTPGKGARFQLVVPRGLAPLMVSVDPTHERVSTASLHLTPTDQASSLLRILLVDDLAAVRKVLRDTLHDWPQLCVVGEASNGFEAITQVRTLNPDVVLMDVSMPKMDGVEATRQLHMEFPSVYVLGVSIEPATARPHPIEQAGAVGFFVKGVDTRRLIEHLVQLHSVRRRLAEST
jgi:PAS domain S-box-containing protein